MISGHSRRPTIAVAVPTYLRERVLIDTLEQVLKQSPPADEIIVVDQTPEHEQETKDWLSRQASAGRLKWLTQAEPNLPRARNRALRESQCDVVLFIDDDVVLAEDFVEQHRRCYEDPGVDAVAGRVEQRHEAARVHRARTWDPRFDYKFFSLAGTERVTGVASFRGCNHSVKAAPFRALGGYDENYIGWAYREDSDAALRLWRSGATIVFEPTASLLHLAAPAGGCRLRSGSGHTPEWLVSFPAHYFAFRHSWPTATFWADALVHNFRRYVLRRTNIMAPWRLPLAAVAYLWSFGRAYSAARSTNDRTVGA